MKLDRREFVSSLLGAAGLAVLPASWAGPARTFRQAFEQPPSEARPWVRWWWPGGVVEDEELRREIGVLHAAGFGGAEIQAFNPAIPKLTPEERARLHDFANARFLSHLDACTGEARKRGMQIDSTFGSAWPSGGGFAVTPELALLELTAAVTTVSAPAVGPIRLKIPDISKKFGAMSALDARTQDPRAQGWRERLNARQKIVAVVAVKGAAPALENNRNFRTAVVKAPGAIAAGPGIVLTEQLGPDGVLHWQPPADGSWQIIVFKQFAVDSSVMAGVGEGPQLVLDHFKRAAFDAHAQRMAQGLLPASGKAAALRATFVDSLELMPDMYWSEDLLAQFQARRGYDLTPYLQHVLQRGWMEAWNQHAALPYFDAGEVGERVRADYRLTVSELLVENFWQPYADWNHRHGLQARIQAHGGPSDVLQAYGVADIPETEDLESGAETHFLRLARAAADLYGRRLVSCESLVWAGKSFEITPAQWLARVNLLFASGVNSLVLHGFPYALHQEAWPGWYPFAPSAFLAGFSSMLSEQNPLWAAVPQLTAYVSRLQGVLQHGRNAVPVAVYLGEIGYFHGMEPAATHAMLERLLADGYDYDRINDHAILRSRVRGKRLETPGGASFAALVLPARPGLRSATADKLAEFARAGLPIFYADAPPSRAEGYADAIRQDVVVRDAVQRTLGHGAQICPATALPQALRQAGVPPNLTFVGDPCLFVEKTLAGRSAYFLHNPEGRTVTVEFATRAKGIPQRWDALTGEYSAVRHRQHQGAAQVTVDIAAGGAALIVFGERAAAAGADSAPIGTLDLSQGPWTMKVDGHGRNGQPMQREMALSELKDWSAVDGLAGFSGAATYAQEVSVPSDWLRPGHRVRLQLGQLHDMAVVTINGKQAPALIARPYDIDITTLLQAGSNRFSIRILNSPNNAMMDPKKAGLKDLKQQPAGLLGPVTLVHGKANL
ncbi:glycosyl hydrolase [Oxalobacteraceae bacterium A2-2]